MNDGIIFNVGKLIASGEGVRDLYSFDIPIDFEDVKIKSSIRGKAELMRIKEGVNARLTDVEMLVEGRCDKCLKKINNKVLIDEMERQFFLRSTKRSEVPNKQEVFAQAKTQRPSYIEDPNDTFFIDEKTFTIDLTEPLRQEIILHFPLIQVCSKSCKGICPVCGKNRNKEECNCKPIKTEGNKPLAVLKTMIK